MARQILAYDDIVSPPKAAALSLPADSTKNDMRSVVDAAQVQSHNAGAAASLAPSSQPDLKRKRAGDCNDLLTGTQMVSRPLGPHQQGGASLGEDTTAGGAPIPSPAYTTSFPNIPKPPHKKNRAKRQRERARGGAPGYNAGGAANSYGNATSNGRSSSSFGAPVHWDDPGAENMDINYDGDGIEGGALYGEDNAWDEDGAQIGDEDGEGESRDLTHEEIWDDSALIEAWDAAIEEYEAVNGKNKDWKKNRKHRSPLWYNVPPENPSGSSKLKGKAKEISKNTEESTEGSSSVPLNFDTFVPTHDASLSSLQPAQPPPVPDAIASQYNGIMAQYASTILGPEQDMSTVTPDEAFNRAIGAMYWCGYWSAIYHVQRAHETNAAYLNANGEEAADENEEEETEDLVSTQR